MPHSNKKRRNNKKKTVRHVQAAVESSKPTLNVEIDYVMPEVDQSLPEEYQRIFQYFTAPALVDEEEQRDVEMEMNADRNEESDASSQSDMEMSDHEEDRELLSTKSRRKLKESLRPSVADLKKKVDRPDLVEWWDVTAKDPEFLVFLKSCRNTVQVPSHWCQKRRYLQGKRGYVKAPFELPAYIADTGIGKMRETVAEKDDSRTLKAKMRAARMGKLGKLSLDYQRLHEAFFKFQTKPANLSIIGRLYYEGKEFEVTVKEKRPGYLSSELKEALGMENPLIPPPWLLNMQRHGPPPSYPHLKIPGLNCQIPEGAQWGFQPGGWGRPPIDEYNRPLYGDVFGVYDQYQRQMQESIESGYLSVKPERKLWGEVSKMYNEDAEDMEYVPDQEEVEAEEATEIEQEGVQKPLHEIEIQEYQPEKQFEYESDPEEEITLHKDEPKSLYTIIQQDEGKSGVLMGAMHTYALGKQGGSVDISVNPDEVDSITAASLEEKYAKEVASTSHGLLEDCTTKKPSSSEVKKPQDKPKKFKF